MKTLLINRFSVLAGIALALVIMVSLPVIRAHAAIDASSSLAIIPPRFELFGNPGDTVVDKLQVENQSGVSQNYSIDIQDFSAQGDEGGVNLIDPTTDKSSYQLAKWVTVEPSRFTVAANSESVLNIVIKIPTKAEPGGHYASVLVRKDTAESPGGAAVDTRIGSLILLRVSGAVTESASIDYFKAQDSFAQYGPVTLDLRTMNKGNVHVNPTGTIVVTNMFGSKVAELPLTSSNVLPGSARVVHTIFDQKNLIGKYTATLVATYGQNTDATGNLSKITATTTFYVFPLYLLWILLAVIVAILLLITQRKKVRKLINKLTQD